MDCSFERLIQLLGLSPTGIRGSSLIEFLDKDFFSIEIGKGESVIHCPNAGLILATMDKTIQVMLFELNRPTSDVQGWHNYSGPLIKGICSTDTRSDVQRKLAVKPCRTETIFPGIKGKESVTETYELLPLILSFSFDGIDGIMDGLSVTKVFHEAHHLAET